MAATQPISPNSPTFRFGPFELYPAPGELRKTGLPIKLQPQPFKLLLLLIERAGTVVTRDEIRQRLWSGSTFVDFEHGINFSINQIRGALADNADEPRGQFPHCSRRGGRQSPQLGAGASDCEEI
jgi:DNA-binding winged helix-turn-helix (wHTH) protein